ncbi:MAG: prepilin-type N-terminal cleavage/methylation domain-containing protein [bacterium]
MENQRGQSLVELLVAMGVFVLAVSVISFLIMESYLSERSAKERTIALLLAQEGMEAARSIRDSGFDNLIVGSHGLAVLGSQWIFFGSSDGQDKFSRRIIVSEATGEIDQTDIKKIESQVVWQIAPGREAAVNLVDYLTDWKQNQGESGQLNISTSLAKLGGGNKELEGIGIENVGESSVVVDKITAWWNNSNLIEEIRIEGTKVWKYNGEGFPDGKQSSGTELDIVDYVVGAGSLDVINGFGFDSSMEGAVFIILFRMADNSTKYVLVEPDSEPPLPVNTCSDYCQNLGYSSGACRQNSGKCGQNGEVYESGGDQYCAGGASADTCCCLP